MTPLDIRLTLLQNGYDPLPLRGKRPAMNAWTGVVADLDLIQLWSAHKGYPDALNTGVLTRRTPGLDLDVLIPECADAMEACIREEFEERGTVLCRIGSWPKRLIPFRTDEPFSKINMQLIAPDGSEQKIEFLSDGQQFASFGEHPDTHSPYGWPRGSILETPREDLPYIRQAEAQALVDKLVAIALSYGYRLKNKPKSNGGTHTADSTFPFDWQRRFANLIDHDEDASLAFALINSGMGGGAAINLMTGLVRQFTSDADPARQERRIEEIPALVNSAQRKHAEQQTPPPIPPEFANLELDGVEVPEPEWSVPNRIPARQACLFTGHGAAGKSTIGLHLCVAHVLGKEWLGSFPMPGPAIFLDAEDDFHVIWRRLEAIRKHYDTTYRAMIDGGLRILPMAGKDVVLATLEQRTNKIIPTPFYNWLLAQAIALRAEQVLIASVANVFAGNENDRSQVQQFETLLVNIAQQTGGSITLIGHPSWRGMDKDRNNGNAAGFSGSTAWHNSFRSRIWIEAEDDVPDLRRISFLKNQYGPEDESLTVHWRDGMFLPPGKQTSYEQAASEAKAETTVLEFIREYSRNGQDFAASLTAHSHPATLMDKAGARNGFKKPDLVAATNRLIDKGSLKVTTRGRYNYVVIP